MHINYDAFIPIRKLTRDEACTIAARWHSSQEDPIYAFSSTGCIQNEMHRSRTRFSIADAIDETLDRWGDLADPEVNTEPNTIHDLQDLADLLVYITLAPIEEVV